VKKNKIRHFPLHTLFREAQCINQDLSLSLSLSLSPKSKMSKGPGLYSDIGKKAKGELINQFFFVFSIRLYFFSKLQS
jgi:hypothetical protein